MKIWFVRGESIDLSVINPRREKSGVYKVILRNGQGQDERDITVNIMGRHSYSLRLKGMVSWDEYFF
jgi:hypothetical protein